MAAVLIGRAFIKLPEAVPFGSLLYEKKVYLILVPQFIMGMVGIGLAVLLAPGLGIEGVALSGLAGIILQFCVGAFVAARYTRVGLPIDWKRWLTLIGLMVGAVLAAFAFDGQGFWTLAIIKLLLWLGVAAIVFWRERATVIRRARQLANGRLAHTLVDR